MNLKELIRLTENECGECGKRFYEVKRRPLEHCPHCNEELTFFNSQEVGGKFVEVQIDFRTGEAKVVNNKAKI